MKIGHLISRLAPIAVVSLLFVVGCGPKYPKCENDTHCSEKSEYCVNGLCQQCRENTHCSEGQQCLAGRCEAIPGYCKGAEDCAAGQKCRANRCGPQCISNDECAGGEKCQNGSCVPGAECYADDDCGTGMKCQSGKCLKAVVSCNPNTVYFDYDASSIRESDRASLEATASCLSRLGNPSTTVEGHCDERGTEEYNLALGERRAQAVQQYLERLGARSLRTVSYGENRPVDSGSDEDAWSKNRRAEFNVQK